MKPADGPARSWLTSAAPPEFKLLSMTELRNRPGEILDRVADDGDAFIVERNGQRKACLVPLSAFFPDIPPARIVDELDELARGGERPRISITENRELTLTFRHNSPETSPLEITAVLPHGYPNSCPRVYIAPLDSKVPHRWADGALCLFGVMSTWNPGKHTITFTLSLARRWLAHYAAWTKTGRWPTTEPARE